MAFFDVGGCQLWCEANGQGTAVAYIHGGFACLAYRLQANAPPSSPGEPVLVRTWENDFIARHRFVDYDRRGCYRSPAVDTGYELENQADDLAALLDVLEIGAAHVVGSSAGGPIAIAFAAHHGGRVLSLVLAGTALNLFPEDDPVTPAVRRQMKVLQNEGPSRAFDSRPSGVEVSYGAMWEPDEMRERGELAAYEERVQRQRAAAEDLSRADRVAWHTRELRALDAYLDRGDETAQWAAEIDAPTLVLHGERDQEVPLAWGRRLAAHIPGARLEVMDGSHSLVVRKPDARSLMLDFYRALAK